jgi:hypothetical protein
LEGNWRIEKQVERKLGIERERERERDVVTQQQPSVSERSTAAVSVEIVPGTDGFTTGCTR